VTGFAVQKRECPGFIIQGCRAGQMAQFSMGLHKRLWGISRS